MDRVRGLAAERLGWVAAALASVAAAVGLLVPGIYRDQPILVDATRIDHVFQLVVVVPLFAAGALASRRGSVAGRLALVGTLLYLAYFFGLYALAAVVNAMTLVHVAVVGLALWSVIVGLPQIDADAVERTVGPRLFRRSTIAFLLLVAGFHIPLWAGQIVASAASGELPAALVTFGWLNTPVFTFDLAFALPLGIVAAVFLGRGDARGSLLAIPFTWFSLLLALDMFVEQVGFAVLGRGLDVSQALPFGVIAVASALVLAPSLVRRRVVSRSHVPAPA